MESFLFIGCEHVTSGSCWLWRNMFTFKSYVFHNQSCILCVRNEIEGFSECVEHAKRVPAELLCMEFSLCFSERWCLHIKYSMFGKCMNECMSGPAWCTECVNTWMCLSVFFFNIFPEVRKKKECLHSFLVFLSWCEVGMLQHMHIHMYRCP